MAEYRGLNQYNVAPKGASGIGVFKDGNLVGRISLGTLRKSRGAELYRVGLLSDVHQNDDNDQTESFADLQNALAVYKTEGCEFCICCGDIIENNTRRGTEYPKYKSVVTAQPLAVYACTGNHDVQYPNFDLGAWKTNVNTRENPAYVSGGTGASFEITRHGDHYLFLSMQLWKPSDSETHNGLERAYSEEELVWLAEKLEEYRNERTFVITHLFFPEMAGNWTKGGVSYYSNNMLAGENLARLMALLNKYPNTIWFSGHSHWKWYLQGVQPDVESYKGKYCNVCRNGNGAWTIHIPSCAKSIDYDYDNNRRDNVDDWCYNKSSEGGVMIVYENAIEIQGISFKTNNHGSVGNTQYDNTKLPIANYYLDTILRNVPADGTDEGGGDVTPPSGGGEDDQPSGSDPETPEANINGIAITAEEQDNWLDVTDIAIGTGSSIYNGDTQDQPSYSKVGVRTSESTTSTGYYSLKAGVALPAYQVNGKVKMHEIKYNNDVTTTLVGSNMTGCAVELLTSSKFSLAGLATNSAGKRLRVIFKNMMVKNVVTGVVKEVSVDNFYYSDSDVNGYTGRAIPTSRADGAIYIDFYLPRQKLLIFIGDVMNKFDNESYEVTIGAAAVLMSK